MGGNISVHSKEKDGSVFSFKLPLRTVQQVPSSPISNDESECLGDGDHEDVTYAIAPRSFQSKSIMSSPNAVPYHPPGPLKGHRNVKYLSPTPSLHIPSGMRFDQRNPAAEVLSQMRELHSTMEPSPAGETKAVHYEDYRHNSSAHLDAQGPSLHHAFQYGKSFDKEDPVKSHHRSNASSTNRLHGGRIRKCVQNNIRSSPVLGNTRKTEKTQISERRTAREPLPAAKVVKYSRPFRILVAEDDPVNVKVATQMMVALGHELKVVNNGADAVQAVQQGSYDVVLMVSKHPI